MSSVSLKEILGSGYEDFWNFRGRYRIVKGSRASKKSKTSAIYYIYNMMKFPQSNLLVIRKTFRTLKDSCFTELKWAINRLDVDKYWKITESPLQIEYLPTGQKIYFRGLDDPLKITSITVDVGSLCWLWIEEAYEISSEPDFNAIDESIRGQVANGLFKQITLTFNPWNEHHWIKARFFDNPSPEILALSTNYLCNEFLDSADLSLFESMKINNPRRYQVAGLGHWGIVDGLVFENWVEQDFDVPTISAQKNVTSIFGLDFGYTNDPTAFFCGLIDLDSKQIWVFDELYQHALQAEEIYAKINEMGYSKEVIVADSSRPDTIDRLRTLGLRRISSAKKGSDSVLAGIDFLLGFKIIIHPSCTNFTTEISNYTWVTDKHNNKINRPIDDFNHLIDALRYSAERHSRGSKFTFA